MFQTMTLNPLIFNGRIRGERVPGMSHLNRLAVEESKESVGFKRL